MLEGNGKWISVQNSKLISSQMAEIWRKISQKQALFTSFWDFTVIFRILFLNRFWRFKSVLGPFFTFFAKMWPKNMYHSSKSRFFFTFFTLVTWDDLDLYYDHKEQEMILTNVRDTIHANSLALFELNVEILLADITKPEKSNILTLTWPVASLVTPRSLKFVSPSQFFQDFQMPLEFLESVQ